MSDAPIWDINIKPVTKPGEPSLLAYADFTTGTPARPLRVHGTEVFRGDQGRLNVRFALRPYPAECEGCRRTIGATHKYCHFCGSRQAWKPAPLTDKGVPKLHREFIHPVTETDRESIAHAILGAWLVAVGVRPPLRLVGESA